MASSTSNFLPFREFATIAQGYEACELEGAESLPFIVRASSLAKIGQVYKGDVDAVNTSWPSVAMIRKQLGFEVDVHGYSCDNGDTVQMSGIDTLVHYDAATLRHNVVDAESKRSCTSLLSTNMIARNQSSRVDQENWLAYVVSPLSTKGIGALHCDPPFG